MNTWVSIITPSLNQGVYIEETIKSVLNQNYPHVEYIVVDGGSSDNTLDILKKYDQRIRWLSEADNGQADAINKGIYMAKGEIVAWLNSDDILLPGAIRKVVDCFHQHPNVGIVYSKSHFIDTSGKVIGRYPTQPFDFKRLAMFNFICQPSTFFRKYAFYDVGGLDVGLHYALDYELWIKIAQRFNVIYLQEDLACYRLHEKSKTVSYHHLLRNHEEGLDTALRYYNWAPANRVYGYCYHWIEAKLPLPLRRFRPLTILLGLLFSTVKYIKLNRGIRLGDIKEVSLENLKKLFIPWDALYKSY